MPDPKQTARPGTARVSAVQLFLKKAVNAKRPTDALQWLEAASLVTSLGENVFRGFSVPEGADCDE